MAFLDEHRCLPLGALKGHGPWKVTWLCSVSLCTPEPGTQTGQPGDAQGALFRVARRPLCGLGEGRGGSWLFRESRGPCCLILAR